MTITEPERARATESTTVATVFQRVRARAELALEPIEFHAHQLLTRPLDGEEVDDAREAAAVLTRGLGRLQHQGVLQPARRIEELLGADLLDRTTGVAVAAAVEDTRTMLASAVAQLEGGSSSRASILAVGTPSARLDAVLWVLAHHGHRVVHHERDLPALADPPDAVIVHVTSDPEATMRTTLPAVVESYAAPVVVLHDPLPVATRAALSRFCSTLLPADTPPGVISDEVLRLRAAATTELSALVWGFPAAGRRLTAHGFLVTEIDGPEGLAPGPGTAVVLGAGVDERDRHQATRLLRVSPATRRAPVVWEGPLSPGRRLAAAVLGVVIVDRFDDAAAANLTSELRRAAADTDPAAARPDAVLAWPAARLLIDRSLISSQRSNAPSAVGVVRLDDPDDRERRDEVGQQLGREFRRGDVVGATGRGDFVVCLSGIGQRIALDRLGGLAARLGADTRVGIAEFPTGGRSADELVEAAESALDRAAAADGPAVVSTAWRPVAARPSDVIIVDRDIVLGEMVAGALGDTGLRARVMTDGHEALSHLVACSPDELPRLLIIDLDLGGADGRALLSTLAQTGVLSHVRVLAMASKGTENDLRIALGHGASDVIRKPFPMTILEHRVAQVLGG